MISAVDDLYIANRQPQDAAQCLIDITLGSNMGEYLTPNRSHAASASKSPTVTRSIQVACMRSYQCITQACSLMVRG